MFRMPEPLEESDKPEEPELWKTADPEEEAVIQIPEAKEEPEATQEPEMSPEMNIAREYSRIKELMQQRPIPEKNPLEKAAVTKEKAPEKPGIARNSSNSNKMMTPAEIAALIASL